MTTEKLWSQYQHYTRELTEHSRKLAFACAAICWFFKTPEITFPPKILWSLGLLVLFFLLDVLHYLTGSIVYRVFTHRQEQHLLRKTGSYVGEVDVPRSLDRAPFTLFVAKSLALLASFAALASEFYSRIAQHA